MISKHKKGSALHKNYGEEFTLVECTNKEEGSRLVIGTRYYTLQHSAEEGYHVYDLDFNYHSAAYKHRFVEINTMVQEETLKDFK